MTLDDGYTLASGRGMVPAGVTISPSLCNSFRVRFSLTVHDGFVDKRSVWILAIPRVGLAARSFIRAALSSTSEGIVEGAGGGSATMTVKVRPYA